MKMRGLKLFISLKFKNCQLWDLKFQHYAEKAGALTPLLYNEFYLVLRHMGKTTLKNVIGVMKLAYIPTELKL